MTYQEQALKFLGITRFHQAGYTGKGIKILSRETVTQKNFPNVIAPKGYASKSGHGDNVMAHIVLVAPDAEHISLSFGGTYTTDTYKNDCVDYILANNVDICTTSLLGGEVSGGKAKAIQECLDNNCIMIVAAGNNGSRGLNEESKSPLYLAIGGVKPRYTYKHYDDDEPMFDFRDIHITNYSSEGKELDYVTIAEILGCAGTSFCSPVFASMLALVQQFFVENIGRKLTNTELIEFVDNNLVDTDEEGFDIRTGKGIFVLPEPNSIDLSKYKTSYIDYSGFPEVRSDVEMRGIDKLHPDMQMACNKFLEECNKQGLNVLITETLRTQAEQEKLYAQGRTTAGSIVTNCRGYQSPHCWGVAFDFCRNVKGKEYDNSDGFFDKVGEIAKVVLDNTEYDLFWGGDFKTFVDKPHVEMKKFLPNNSTKDLISKYETPENFKKTWINGDDNMLKEIMEELKISEEELKSAIMDLVNHKIAKNERPDWYTEELENNIRELQISDCTRPNDYATRCEVATMVYNSTKKKGE